MRLSLAGILLATIALGCAAPMGALPDAESSSPRPPLQVAAPDGIGQAAEPETVAYSGAWVGAAGLSERVMGGTSETMLGVWVDVPQTARQKVPSSAVALVVDTSGSMSGAKIEHAKSAAGALVERLSNGDLVSLYSFSDDVQERMPLTPLSSTTRATFATAVSMFHATGSTNLFEGLRSAERSVFGAPASHSVRRVVVISDGQANVGPSSPDVLGALAARGSEHGIQVTAVGVGLDYDERTLNALAAQSSGRLYHLTESRELAGILQQEMGLLQATAATGAFVEIVPAPGVEILGIENEKWTPSSGSVKVQLGSMFAGQHRELLVRVRVTASVSGSHPLASVRLHFRDPADGNVERVQETVARYQVAKDTTEIAAHENARTREIVAVNEAAKLARAAAEKVAKGDVDKAARDLAEAEEKLLAQARVAKDEADRKRITATATNVAKARKATQAAATASAAARPAAARAAALEANQADMKMMGF